LRKKLLCTVGDPADGKRLNNTFTKIRSSATATAARAILQLRDRLLCISRFFGNGVQVTDNIVVVCLRQLHLQAVRGAVSQVKLLFSFLESLLRFFGIKL
jgi:hypothetical protein